jgi:hypothetical protein
VWGGWSGGRRAPRWGAVDAHQETPHARVSAGMNQSRGLRGHLERSRQQTDRRTPGAAVSGRTCVGSWVGMPVGMPVGRPVGRVDGSWWVKARFSRGRGMGGAGVCKGPIVETAGHASRVTWCCIQEA